MSDTLAVIELLTLGGSLPAGSMLPATRRQRLIFGGLGLGLGVVCHAFYHGNIHNDVGQIIGMAIGYSVAIGALMAEVINWSFRKLRALFRSWLEESKEAVGGKP